MTTAGKAASPKSTRIKTAHFKTHRVDDVDYRCFGLFYDWQPQRQDYAKRALLEIVHANATAPALEAQPDAVVVMMNPGSSAPLAAPHLAPLLAEQETLVPAKPDSVQYQVMRLMSAAKWRHVRIVNLSDVRAAKSADLYALIEAGATRRDLGAMFANSSAVNLAKAVTAPVVICAWGMDKRLGPLAREAHDWITAQGYAPLGVRADTPEFPAYRYPKPVGNWNMALAWLDTLKQQVAPFSG
jgi:hypothetical protein